MTDDNVTALWGQEVPKGGFHPSVVTCLEELLSRAQRGEVCALAIVVIQPNYDWRSSFVVNHSLHGTLLLGALARATQRFAAHLGVEEAEPLGGSDAPA